MQQLFTSLVIATINHGQIKQFCGFFDFFCREKLLVQLKLQSCPISYDPELLLIMIDYYSKWIEAKPIAAQTSGAVMKPMKSIFSCFGIPTVSRSTNGTCYVNKDFRKIAERTRFILTTSSLRYPASNGLAESAVKTAKQLRKKCEDRSLALLAYRTTPLPSGFSPSDLMFGRPNRSKLGVCYEIDIDCGQFEENETLCRRNTGQLS